MEGAWGPSGVPAPGPRPPGPPTRSLGCTAAQARPREMHYINVNFPPSRAPSFHKLSARLCQSNFSHFVSLFSVWGNPVSPGRGGLAAGKVQLCRLVDRPTAERQYGLYYFEVCFLYAHFLESFSNHKWMLNFVKGFLCIYLDDHMVYIFQFVDMVYDTDANHCRW